MLREKTQRRIVPRWRPSVLAPSAPEFATVKKPSRPAAPSPDQGGAAFRAFIDDQSLGTASEALAEGLLERNSEATKSAATFILHRASQAPGPLLTLARDASGGALPGPQSTADDVTRLRALLRLSPRNAAVWADMARHYASEGNKRQALKCMKTALQLAPDHRWMLRTAARFLVHQENAEAAHRLLANHPRSKGDPWLIAAELACAHVAGKAPKFWKLANDILRFDRFGPAHVSELATAIGMMELEAGNRKQARKLVNRGLIAPTENTLAQVLWAKEAKHLGDGTAKLDTLIRAREDAFEAEFKVSLRRGDLQTALAACQSWTSDEPFAARPKHEKTYLAALLDDHQSIIRIAEEVTRIDGRVSVGIELNLIFARLSAGTYDPDDLDQLKRDEARLLGLVKAGGPVAMHALANLALFNYRYGNPEVGKVLYREAIDLARKIEGHESAAHAAIFAAREALLTGEETADVQLSEAIDLAKRSGNEACLFYTRKLQAVAAAPELSGQILSPSSASQFLKPVKVLSIAKEKDGYVLTIGRD